MADQQPTVAHTYDLPIPIKRLPGEDDIKLQEGYLLQILSFIN